MYLPFRVVSLELKVALIYRLQFVSNFRKKRISGLNTKPLAIFGRHGSFCCSPCVTCPPSVAFVCVHFRDRIKDSSWSVQNFTCCVYVYLRVLFLFFCFALFVCLFFLCPWFNWNCLAFKFKQEPMSRSNSTIFLSRRFYRPIYF